MVTHNKEVPLKTLKKGDTFNFLHLGGGSGEFGKFVVEDINNVTATLSCYGHQEVVYVEDATVDVPMTTEEFRERHINGATQVMEGLANELEFRSSEIGEHEMYNGWIREDPWETAAACEQERIKIVGWAQLSHMAKEHYNIGFVAEDMDTGERFWCHASSNCLEYYKNVWKEYKEQHNANA